jgi:hypothetical protein
MLLGQHFLDTGYVNADVLATSQQRFGALVISPTHPDVNRREKTKKARISRYHLRKADRALRKAVGPPFSIWLIQASR